MFCSSQGENGVCVKYKMLTKEILHNISFRFAFLLVLVFLQYELLPYVLSILFQNSPLGKKILVKFMAEWYVIHLIY